MMPATVPSLRGGSVRCRGGIVMAPQTATAATRAAVIMRSFFTKRFLEARLGLEGRGLVGALPGELGLGPAEVSEGRRLLVDGPPQVELLHDAAGGQLEGLAHELGDLFF